jgi:hypothetical protein
LKCVFSWPLDTSIVAVIDQLDESFSGVMKPDHFTNFEHCDECRDHDEALRNRSLTTITRDDLGNEGWSPITFCTPVGLAYYIPALARFAVAPSIWNGRDAYAVLLATRLSFGRSENDFLKYCNDSQRAAMAMFIQWIADNESKLDLAPFTSSDFLGHWTSWEDGATVWQP